MNKLVLCAAAATTVATAFAAPSSAAPTDPPLGRKCAFNSATDVTREAGWQTGQLNAGPLVTLEAGTLYCTIVKNSDSHSGSAVYSASATATAGAVAVIAPRVINYPATAADDISLCTSWVPDSGPAKYWVSQPGGLGEWSTDPGASCGVALSIEPNDPTCSIWHSIDNRAGTNIAEIWQDCEGYPPII